MRKINSLKNFLSVVIPFLIIGVLGFIRVRFFVQGLGEDISSLNQLFNNLLAYLSLAEGGIGLFVVQKYYKCLVDKDYDKVSIIFNASKRFFKIVSCIILISGIILSFFLGILTNNGLTMSFMQLAFVLFLIRYSIEYWFYAPRFVIQADQKLYKVNYYLNFIRVLEMLAEILLLKLTSNYFLILIPGIIIRLVGYPLVNTIIYKLYPYLKNKVVYDNKVLKGFHNIISQKVSGLVFENTDVIIVSTFLTPLSVIVYTSYNYISKYLNDITYMVTSSAMSSLGNALYEDSKEKNYSIFNKFNYLLTFIATFFSVCFMILINCFIVLWVGEKYVSSLLTVFLFVIVLYINIVKKPINTIKDGLGLFKETKWIILLEAALNIGLSLLLVKKFQINGILLGTILSSLFTTFWFIPWYVYKSYYQRDLLDYFIPICFGLVIISVIALILPKLVINVANMGMWLVVASCLAIIMGVVIFAAFYLPFKPFKEVIKDIKTMMKGVKHEEGI